MDSHERLIAKKLEWAKAKRGLVEDGVIQDHRARSDRLPPGQHLTKGWPVLDLGIHPDIRLAEWRLSVTGLVAAPFTWTWEEFLAQPQIRSVSDFHCVTTWSTFGNAWEGVSFRHLLQMARLRPEARFVFFKTYDDYSTNLPLEACDDDGSPVALAHCNPKRNGHPEQQVPGWPTRGMASPCRASTVDRFA